MRLRTLLLILAVAAVAALAYLNQAEVLRTSPLNLGWTQVQVPLVLALLGLLALAVLVSLATGASQRGRHHAREQELTQHLQHQRELADRAEASRFTDLRQTLDTHMKDSRQRENGLSAAMEQTLMRHQRESRNQFEGLQRALASRLGEMEARLDARLDALSPGRNGWTASGPAAAATQETGQAASWAEPPEATASLREQPPVPQAPARVAPR